MIVRKFTRDWCAGFAPADLESEGSDLELLDNSGKLLLIRWETVKWVCFVRELLSGPGTDAANPERLLRRRFASRPRIAGLWLRLILSDNDELEGVAANDCSLLEGPGLLLTPPDTRSNTQRIYIPRTAVREFTVLAVIGAAAPVHHKLGPQPGLFPEEQFALELNEN